MTQTDTNTAPVTAAEIQVLADSISEPVDVITEAVHYYRIPDSIFDWDTMAVDRFVVAERIGDEWVVAESHDPSGVTADLKVDYPELEQYEVGLAEDYE